MTDGAQKEDLSQKTSHRDATHKSEVVPAPPAAAPPAAPVEADPDDAYRDPISVDQMAFAIMIPELPLPPDEEISSGSLRIKILIGKNGAVNGIEVLETTFPDEYVSLLLSVFGMGVFKPAILNGRPINSWRVIEIELGEKEVANDQ